jgi:hypothetical protein
MLSYALRPPPDDPHPFLAEKVDICVESVLEGEELRLAGLMTDEEWLVVQRLRHDPAFLENVRRLLASLDGFVPPGVRAVGSPRYMAATTDPPADD